MPRVKPMPADLVPSIPDGFRHEIIVRAIEDLSDAGTRSEALKSSRVRAMLRAAYRVYAPTARRRRRR